MEFETLTKKNIEQLRKCYFSNKSWTEKMKWFEYYTGKSSRTVQRWIKKLGFIVHLEESQELQNAKKRKFDKTKKRFIITWAQNDTPVHKEFLKNIEAYAKFINASIHVIAGRYKNPTSFFSEKNDIWDKDVIKYLDANRHDIHKYISILSDVKIQPTAANPMSSMAGISGINSCVFGSPKVHMEVIPALEGSRPKIMMTTGAITRMNYTDSKAGKKGEFHHTYGFVVIEIVDNENFHIRQVTANDASGEFNDLFYNIKNGKVTKISKIDAIVLGDIHLGYTDETIMKSTIKLLDILKPNYTVIHDLFDGTSISHHDLKNPVKQYYKEVLGINYLKKEIEQMMNWVKKMKKYNLVIVRSNHDDFLDRWILNSDWKFNIHNTLEYIKFAKILIENKAPKGIIPYLINKEFPNVITLGRDQSFKVKKWELGVHGDIGQNGSRGTLSQFRKLNTKIIVGHYHSPQRKDGALSVGTSTKLRIGYNIGASNWLHSHVIIHLDGKAQHIIFSNGRYTTLLP